MTIARPQLVEDSVPETQEASPRSWTEVLCQQCGGNGVVKIHHGVSVCPRCKGHCYDPVGVPYPAVPVQDALTTLREALSIIDVFMGWQSNVQELLPDGLLERVAALRRKAGEQP